MAFVDSQSSSSTAIDGPSVCNALDRANPMHSEFGVSYISESQCVVLREPPDAIEHRIVITPADGPEKPSAQTLQKGLIQVTANCAFAGLATTAAVASCAGVPATFGLSAALCGISVAGAGASSMKCGIAIGKVINHAFDPNLNDILDHDENFKTVEAALDFVDDGATWVSLGSGGAKLLKLRNLRSKYGKDLLKRYTKNESKQIYREYVKTIGDSFSNQQVKEIVNARGYALRFHHDFISSELRELIKGATGDIANLNSETIQKGTNRFLSNKPEGANYSVHYLQQMPSK